MSINGLCLHVKGENWIKEQKICNPFLTKVRPKTCWQKKRPIEADTYQVNENQTGSQGGCVRFSQHIQGETVSPGPWRKFTLMSEVSPPLPGGGALPALGSLSAICWPPPHVPRKPRPILSTPHNCPLTTLPSSHHPYLTPHPPGDQLSSHLPRAEWLAGTLGTKLGQSQANRDGWSAWVPPSQRGERPCFLPPRPSLQVVLIPGLLLTPRSPSKRAKPVLGWVCLWFPSSLAGSETLSPSWLNERMHGWWQNIQEPSCALLTASEHVRQLPNDLLSWIHFFGKQYKMKKHDGVCVHVCVPVLLVHLLL